MHMISISLSKSKILIHPDKVAQIAFLLIEKITIPDEYSDFADFFSEKKALVLLKQIDLNEHAIKLEDDKQPPYGPIYSLGLVELKTFKAYIETYLKTRFIWPSKSPAGAPILFDKKPDGSFRLCVNY